MYILHQAIPHLTTEDDVYDGYFIPKGTIVFGNAWYVVLAGIIQLTALIWPHAYEPVLLGESCTILMFSKIQWRSSLRGSSRMGSPILIFWTL